MYMMKIKIGSENNIMYLVCPDKILNPANNKFYAKTSSLNEKVSVEFYHVLSEGALNH